MYGHVLRPCYLGNRVRVDVSVMSVKKRSVRRGMDLTKEERIDYIVELMRTLVFRRGRTTRMLAQEWKLSLGTVRDDAAEASRIVRREMMEPDTVAVDVGLALQEVMEGALDDGDRRHVIAAAKVWADISGASAPQRIEHKVEDSSPQKASEFMRREFGTVGPESDEEK